MFLVTNRCVKESAVGVEKLGATPNPFGPNELRLAEATRVRGKWEIRILPDTLDERMKREVGLTGVAGAVYASRYVARKLLKVVQRSEQNILFFVHGYNNDVAAVLDRAEDLAATYGVEVLPFTWPANGGGVKGVTDYLSDKRDAQVSVGALGRCFAKLHEYQEEFNREYVVKVMEEAQRLFPDNAESRSRYLAERPVCRLTLNMMLHSMGNYILKHVLGSQAHAGGAMLVFDNVVLVAADANNEGHEEWVDRIQCRNRVYVTINEDDMALAASRMKAGPEQKARLGHWRYNLLSKQAVYVDFTDAKRVGTSHAYFEGEALKNAAVKRFFQKALTGQRAEADLSYMPASHTYRFS